MKLYVAPTGFDSNPGTLDKPMKTLAAARDKVLNLSGPHQKAIEVVLRDGWYVLDAPLTFGPEHSGSAQYPIVYTAYPNEHPVISGGKQISGWSMHDANKNIWKATATGLNTRQLYVNCTRAIRAHYKKGIPGVQKTATGYTTTDSTLQYLGNQNDIELVYKGLPSTAAWSEKRIGIEKISGTNIVLKQPAFDNIKDNPWYNGINDPSDIENAYEFLDEPGEWYLDKKNGYLYYIPRSGEDLATAQVIAPVLESLVVVKGTSGNPVHDIQFKGITFAHATWLQPGGTSGFLDWQANFQLKGLRTPGNISLQSTHNIRFDRCVFKHLGAAGLDMYSGSSNNTVAGCVFTDISGNCIQIGSNDDPLRSDLKLRDTGNTISNCYIHDAPCEFHGGCGIAAAYVSGARIMHNEIAFTPYTGISIGWGWGAQSYMADNIISHNHVHNVMMDMGDGGNFYCLSSQPGSEVHDNYFHDTHEGTAAIYLDEGTSHYDVHHNIIEQIACDWLQINKTRAPCIGNKIHDNFTNSTSLVLQGEFIDSNNKLIADRTWPKEAIAIMQNAGLEKNYQDILFTACGCSHVKAPSKSKKQSVQTNEQSQVLYGRFTPVKTSFSVVKPFVRSTGKTSGRVALVISNISNKDNAQGTIDLYNFYPKHASMHTFLGSFPYSVGPDKKITREIDLSLNPGIYILTAKSSFIGTAFSRIVIQIDCPLKRIGVLDSCKKAEELLKEQPVMDVNDDDGALAAKVQMAFSGEMLAFHAHVLETRLVHGKTMDGGSTIEIYGASHTTGKIGQVFLIPGITAEETASAAKQIGPDQKSAPDIQVISKIVDGGYEITALIPLTAMHIPGNSDRFLLEAMFNTCLPGKEKRVHPSMFHSLSAFKDISNFGRMVMVQ